MALFDLRSGKKISEDFHFNINHDSMTHLLNDKNESDSLQTIEVAKNCNVTKDWLFRQKQVHCILYCVFTRNCQNLQKYTIQNNNFVV